MSLAVTHSVIEATPNDVFAVLQDPGAYPLWVIGARRLRKVDEDWPAGGGCLHHALGALGVTVIRDVTMARNSEPDALLELEAKLRPVGIVVVRLRLTPIDIGTVVTMEEKPVRPAQGCHTRGMKMTRPTGARSDELRLPSALGP